MRLNLTIFHTTCNNSPRKLLLHRCCLIQICFIQYQGVCWKKSLTKFGNITNLTDNKSSDRKKREYLQILSLPQLQRNLYEIKPAPENEMQSVFSTVSHATAENSMKTCPLPKKRQQQTSFKNTRIQIHWQTQTTYIQGKKNPNQTPKNQNLTKRAKHPPSKPITLLKTKITTK